MEFWKRVKELLKSQKLTQEKLCKSCDISLATFSSWIHNERLPDLMSATRIADVLETSVEFLVTGQESDLAKKKTGELKKKIIEFVRKL